MYIDTPLKGPILWNFSSSLRSFREYFSNISDSAPKKSESSLFNNDRVTVQPIIQPFLLRFPCASRLLTRYRHELKRRSLGE